MKVKDDKTGEMRDETDEERKAREAAEKKSDPEALKLIKEEFDCDDEAAQRILDKLDTSWKRNARKWEDRAKENFASKVGVPWDEVTKNAAAYAELQSKNKTELEKLEEANKSEKARGDNAELELMRLRVAVKNGLSESQAKRLVGKNEEELQADAEELVKTFRPDDGGDDTKNGGPTRRPRESFKTGGGKTPEPGKTVKDAADAILEKANA